MQYYIRGLFKNPSLKKGGGTKKKNTPLKIQKLKRNEKEKKYIERQNITTMLAVLKFLLKISKYYKQQVFKFKLSGTLSMLSAIKSMYFM